MASTMQENVTNYFLISMKKTSVSQYPDICYCRSLDSVSSMVVFWRQVNVLTAKKELFWWQTRQSQWSGSFAEWFISSPWLCITMNTVVKHFYKGNEVAQGTPDNMADWGNLISLSQPRYNFIVAFKQGTEETLPVLEVFIPSTFVMYRRAVVITALC